MAINKNDSENSPYITQLTEIESELGLYITQLIEIELELGDFTWRGRELSFCYHSTS